MTDKQPDYEAIAALDAFYEKYPYWRAGTTEMMRAALDAAATHRRARSPSGLGMNKSIADDARKIAEALSDAIAAAQEGSAYKGEYLRTKHGDDEEIERLKTALPLAESLPGKIEDQAELLRDAVKMIDERNDALDEARKKIEALERERDGLQTAKRLYIKESDENMARAEAVETQLAAREADVVRLAEELRQIERVAEMSASIMRDNERTSGWDGSERVARQFDRLAERAARRHDRPALAAPVAEKEEG